MKTKLHRGLFRSDIYMILLLFKKVKKFIMDCSVLGVLCVAGGTYTFSMCSEVISLLISMILEYFRNSWYNESCKPKK